MSFVNMSLNSYFENDIVVLENKKIQSIFMNSKYDRIRLNK